MAVKIGSYKGHATISLNAESKYPFTFGVEKAKAILANLAEIQRFVAANTAKPIPGAGVGKSYPCNDGGYSSGLDDRVADQNAEQCGLNGDGR